MKAFFLFTVAVIFCLSGFAQIAGKISGKIVSSEKPVTGATISLHTANDTAIVKAVISGNDGAFTLSDIKIGKYQVSVSMIGYTKRTSPVFEITAERPVRNFPPINIVPAAKDLADVTVISKKPLIEHKIDRTIINVDASITNIGASAFEILEKSPGISIDKEGNISLQGKDGVMVMVDGRPTQLGASDLANMLRNMNASQLDQIEIMTNPPARYDAAGNAGVINIKTKKTVTLGYNGSINLGYAQGKYPKLNEGFNFNYREGKVNVFTNLSHNYRKNFEVMTIQRNIYNNSNQIQNFFDQEGDKIVTANSYNAKLGMDYFATKKTTFGIMLNGASSPSAVSNDNITEIFTSAKALESVTKATVNNNTRWKSFSGNLNFRTVIDAKGKELTADIDHMVYDSRNNQFMENAYYNATGGSVIKADTLIGTLPQNIKVYSARIDYLHPINKNARFEAGLKNSIVRTDNNANYDSIQNGIIVHDYNRSNHFEYRENIKAAYANLSTSLSKKISAQFGLRLENTTAIGRQHTTRQGFKRDYTQFFPTAYFQYKANDNHNFGLNYGRRVRRPDYSSLNPFIRFIDRYTYSQGNPDLKPQLSDNIELSHTYKNFLTTTLNYTVTNDIIHPVIEQKGQEAYQTQQNIATLKQFGISVSLNKPMYKWWMNSFNVNVFHNQYEGEVNGADIGYAATSFLATTTQQFKIAKTFTAELGAKYRSAMLIGVLRPQPMGVMMIGIGKQIMKNKGAVRLTVRDVFYTQKMRAIIEYGNVDASFQEISDSRVVVLGFTYKFSKGKSISSKKRSTGSLNEEQERIGIDQ